MFALPESIDQVLQSLVGKEPIKLRLHVFLKAFGKYFRPPSQIVSEYAAVRTDLISSKEQRHHEHADD